MNAILDRELHAPFGARRKLSTHSRFSAIRQLSVREMLFPKWKPFLILRTSFLVNTTSPLYNFFSACCGDFSAMTSSDATSDAIPILIADSNRMQSQLLISALRRHSEFE